MFCVQSRIMNVHLAQINIGRLIAPIDDPRIAGFVSQLEPINALADAAAGFVWRLQSALGNATDIPYDPDDPSMMVNMSVWDSVEALRDFVYSSRHVDVFRERAKWFVKLDKPIYCLWWIPGAVTALSETWSHAIFVLVFEAVPHARRRKCAVVTLRPSLLRENC